MIDNQITNGDTEESDVDEDTEQVAQSSIGTDAVSNTTSSRPSFTFASGLSKFMLPPFLKDGWLNVAPPPFLSSEIQQIIRPSLEVNQALSQLTRPTLEMSQALNELARPAWLDVSQSISELARSAALNMGQSISELTRPALLDMGQSISELARPAALNMGQSISELTRPALKLSQYFSNYHALFNEFSSLIESTSTWLPSIERLNEYRGQLLLAAFKEADLWPSPSMPEELVHRIAELVEGGDRRPVVLLVWNYYSRDGYAKLKAAISEWWSDPGFVDRRIIIEQAFEAHKQKWYALSIPALLPLVEGITGDFLHRRRLVLKTSKGRLLRVGDSGQVVRLIMEEMGRAGNLGNGGLDVIHYVMLNAALSFIENVAYKNGDFTSQYDIFRMNRTLHRHSTLHGIQINYDSPMNSLRCFLLLDALYGIRKRYAMIKGRNSLLL